MIDDDAAGPGPEPSRQEQVDLAEQIVAREFEQFQQTQNEGGRAECQDDWPTFHQMRLAQFLAWTPDMLRSYATDLAQAHAAGRNLVTEKYARMMASTEPERYRAELAPHLPALDPDLMPTVESVIARQIAWAREFREGYPRLGEAMRVLTSDEDRIGDTSFETYLRGESSPTPRARSASTPGTWRSWPRAARISPRRSSAGRSCSAGTTASTTPSAPSRGSAEPAVRRY